ncbi:phosphoribosylaminoimidazolecarboxamide formyltransferase [Baileyella intestinalis]|uniref:phosphoribosylaminoimidazolecarboxamide formyltransferase n=1 Tax=Baileyella intestinalis TaxID=2606709 RepID=UPI0022E56974|nr:phosphoribosylaminoimidazolecarboxamide formyltransferase [Baileyella intestinalis]
MNMMELKYGCNPNQKPASVSMEDGSDLPFTVLNGKPGYINLLDALNSWQLVKELKEATGLSSAASFKHVSPTSAAVGRPMSQRLKKACFVDDVDGLDDSPIATAYARARGTDRMSSFGDFIALSDVCDETCARLIKREVSDGIIAPGYDEAALEILTKKKGGKYLVLQMDPAYEPPELEKKQVFGITFSQKHNDVKLDSSCLTNIVTENKDLPEEAKENMIIALIALKYTQSNSVAYAYDGQCIGVGAGQQSRVHCTRLAGSKADNWFLRQSDKVLNLPWKDGIKRPDKDNFIDRYIAMEETPEAAGSFNWEEKFTSKPETFTIAEKKELLSQENDVVLASDAFFPFSDNIERALESGVKYVVQPGGSTRDDVVLDCCNRNNMVMVFNGIRLFHH